jgi:hypothetical protein
MARLFLLSVAACGLFSCTSAPTVAQDANAAMAQNVATPASDPLRSRINAEFASPTIEVSEKDSARALQIVSENVDARLVDGATAFSGQDYRFTASDGMARHVGALTIMYADAATAAAKAGLIASDRRFFRESKVLIPMTAGQAGPHIFIFYTESAGDNKIRAMLSAAAKEVSGTAAR